MPPLLEARQVRKVFRSGGLFGVGSETVAVSDFSMIIDDDTPSFVTLAGESGSGKTTIARLLLGLMSLSGGSVRYRGHELSTMGRDLMRAFRQDVQAIFQDPFEVYNPFYRVDHLLTTPLHKFGLAGSDAEARQLIVEAMETVGLRPEETLGRYPHQLSGGQRQRITIARALLLKPRLIIADEPVSMVDASLRATILGSLHTLHRDFGISFLYITHDLTTAYQVSQQMIVLYQGALVEVGDVEQVIKAPRHPYTRELIRSIPAPEPGDEWISDAGSAGHPQASEDLAVGDGHPPAGQDMAMGADRRDGSQDQAIGADQRDGRLDLAVGADHQQGSGSEGLAVGAGHPQGSADPASMDGCRYAPRCPHATAACRSAPPPLRRTDALRATACYLYSDAPELGDAGLAAVIQGKSASPS